MALIDLTNYATSLIQSTTARADSGPNAAVDGNIFFDVATGRIELITVEEKATLDLTSIGGGATDPNPLSQQDGIKLEALYAFERQERRTDETLRQYDYYFKGTFKFGGAYELVNGRKFDDANGGTFSLTTDDRAKIRGSGWIERDIVGDIGRIYYGVVSLGNIEALSQPYYQLVDTLNAPVDFAKDGGINEAIQVFGDVAKDANTTTFDTRTYLSNKVRTYGQNYDEKQLVDSGVAEMGGYSSGFALGESVHLTTNTTDHPIAAVYNAAEASQTGVWLNMILEDDGTPQVETGFTTADGTFSFVLRNPNGANLDECIAYLDAIAQTDDDIDQGSGTINGKRAGTWYTYNAAGKILPRVGSGEASKGLFIEGLTGTDKNRVIFTDDAAGTKVYPNYLAVSVNVGAGAVSDTNAWFHAFYETGFSAQAGNDFGTSGAIVVQDADGVTDVKGTVNSSGFLSGNNIAFEFDYASDADSGTSGANKNVVFECEGDGGVTAAKTIFTLVDPTVTASITASCVPSAENNV